VLEGVAVADRDLALVGVAAQLPPALDDLRDAGGKSISNSVVTIWSTEKP
jgi:hypothetical protein